MNRVFKQPHGTAEIFNYRRCVDPILDAPDESARDIAGYGITVPVAFNWLRARASRAPQSEIVLIDADDGVLVVHDLLIAAQRRLIYFVLHWEPQLLPGLTIINIPSCRPEVHHC